MKLGHLVAGADQPQGPEEQDRTGEGGMKLGPLVLPERVSPEQSASETAQGATEPAPEPQEAAAVEEEQA